MTKNLRMNTTHDLFIILTVHSGYTSSHSSQGKSFPRQTQECQRQLHYKELQSSRNNSIAKRRRNFHYSLSDLFYFTIHHFATYFSTWTHILKCCVVFFFNWYMLAMSTKFQEPTQRSYMKSLLLQQGKEEEISPQHNHC